MHRNITHSSDAESEGESFICIEHYQVPLPTDEKIPVPSDLPIIMCKYKCLHFSDESLTHFIIRKGEKWDECFIVIPFIEDPEKCLIYYYSEFGTKTDHYDFSQYDPKFVDYLIEKRFEMLLDLKNYCLQQSKGSAKLRVPLKEDKNAPQSRRSSMSLSQMLEEGKMREQVFDERSTMVIKEFKHDPTPTSIIIQKNNPVGMDFRFPNYFRTKHGHLW